MNCTKALVVFSVVVFVDLSSSTKMKESSASSSSDVCDKPTLTNMFRGQSRQKRSATRRVIGCTGIGVSPTITMDCRGSTITIIKGVCVMVTDCDTYVDPSLESQCENSDKTAEWAAYCKTNNPCNITGSCQVGSTCPGTTTATRIYADYECFSDSTTETPSQTPVNEPLSPMPSSADIVQQKTSLFRRFHERRLQNHVIETKHGLSLVECGAACNQRDDCVSFNIGNDVCELNNRVVGGAGVYGNEFVEVQGYDYYEKQ